MEILTKAARKLWIGALVVNTMALASGFHPLLKPSAVQAIPRS
jgi:hypothetical protein